MLTIGVGSNGSGKSRWAMSEVERELKTSTRPIVTTLAIEVGELNKLMQERYPKEDYQVCQRVLVIDKEAMRKFWRYRGVKALGEYGPEPIIRGPWGDDSWKVPDGGVFYVLDEAQVCFNARDWQRIGAEFCEYQSQHRHLGDDVIAIAPSSSLLDKQFRVLCGESAVCTNLYQKSVGIWKAPRKLVVRYYQNCPPLPGEEPFNRKTLYIEPEGLGRCYNTAGGLGVTGINADKGKESRGIPVYWSIVLAAVLGVSAWFLISRTMRYAGEKGAQALSVSKGTTVQQISKQIPGFESVFAQVQSRTNQESEIKNATDAVKKQHQGLQRERLDGGAVPREEGRESKELRVVSGWCRSGSGGAVTLEDGGLLYGTNMMIAGRYITLDGEKFEFIRREREIRSPSFAPSYTRINPSSAMLHF